tara:strand:- start:211 stop:324 length:114 start_codon:yes stop_codon:yes gene_type:complete
MGENLVFWPIVWIAFIAWIAAAQMQHGLVQQLLLFIL